MVIGIIEDSTEERLSAERLAAQESAHRQQLEERIAERTEELNLGNERLREKATQDNVTLEFVGETENGERAVARANILKPASS